ncbi:MAG: ParA family protein [Bdellovibrionota bacterium]
MSVICFGSLKGGVGKTSLSVNVAHAFAERGCEVLLIDLDPMGHASRFFELGRVRVPAAESPIARLFLTCEFERKNADLGEMVEAAIGAHVSLITPVRTGLALLPSGPELRHFLWGRGARLFKELFPRLLQELSCRYDYIVIDTPPDFNVLTRNAIASSDVVVVPVDSSAMSIHCLEEIVSSSAHIRGPAWTIVRSMVTRQASRMQQLTTDRLGEKLLVQNAKESMDDEDDDSDLDLSNPLDFMSSIEKKEARESARAPQTDSPGKAPASPIYLLRSLIYRTEQQNRLSFVGKTAFDVKGSPLREHYSAVSREIEGILALAAENDPLLDVNENFPLSVGLQ